MGDTQVDREWLAPRMGTFVHLDGQSWMLVGVRGKWAVLENEDERTRQIGVASVRRLFEAEAALARRQICTRCEAELTETDVRAGTCTQCGQAVQR